MSQDEIDGSHTSAKSGRQAGNAPLYELMAIQGMNALYCY